MSLMNENAISAVDAISASAVDEITVQDALMPSETHDEQASPNRASPDSLSAAHSGRNHVTSNHNAAGAAGTQLSSVTHADVTRKTRHLASVQAELEILLRSGRGGVSGGANGAVSRASDIAGDVDLSTNSGAREFKTQHINELES